MFEKEKREKAKAEISELCDQFGDMSSEEFREGSWLVQFIQNVLAKHSEKVDAEYFREKYRGLDDERIAYRLTKTASNYTGAAGAVAAGAVSAGELSTLVTGGTSWAVVGASLVGELAYITQQQVKLIYDIAVVLEADLDTEDPEDIMTLFWFALGVNMWEEASNIMLKVGPRGAAYLGRKALRAGARKAMQEVAKRFGGTMLARKLTERSLLKLIVPGINVPIAFGVNKWFTNKLGKSAIKRLKHRSAMVRPLRKMEDAPRETQLLTLPVIFHVGISDEPKDIDSRLVEMQAVTASKLEVSEAEDERIRELLDLPFSEFLEEIKSVPSDEAADVLVDTGVVAHLLSASNGASRPKLDKLATSLRQDGVAQRIKFTRSRYLG